MSKRRTITKVAVASAATSRAARSVSRTAAASPATTRVVEDATWRMTREVTSSSGTARVVFYATDLRSGRRIALN